MQKRKRGKQKWKCLLKYENVQHFWHRMDAFIRGGLRGPVMSAQTLREGGVGAITGVCWVIFVYLKTLQAYRAAVIITVVMIVVIHSVIVAQPIVTFNYWRLWLWFPSQLVQHPPPHPDTLITVKRKSIHIRFPLYLCTLNRVWQKGGRGCIHVVPRGSSRISCVDWLSTFLALKSTNISRLEDGQFKFLSLRRTTFDVQLQLWWGSMGLEWQVCVCVCTLLTSQQTWALPVLNWSLCTLPSFAISQQQEKGEILLIRALKI